MEGSVFCRAVENALGSRVRSSGRRGWGTDNSEKGNRIHVLRLPSSSVENPDDAAYSDLIERHPSRENGDLDLPALDSVLLIAAEANLPFFVLYWKWYELR